MANIDNIKDYIVNKQDNSNRNKIRDKIFDFIINKQFYCAVAYAKVCKLRENKKDGYFDKLYTALAYAFDDPSHTLKAYGNFYFQGEEIENKSFNDDDFISWLDKDFVDFLFLSIVIRVLYSYEDFSLIDIDDINDKLENDSDILRDISKEEKEIKEDLKKLIKVFYDFGISDSIPFVYFFVEDQEEKNKIRDREKNKYVNLNITKFDLEKESTKYLSVAKDYESDIRKKIFSVDSNLYNDLNKAIDKKNINSLLLLDNTSFYEENGSDFKFNRKNLKDYVKMQSRKIDTNFQSDNPERYDVLLGNLEELLKNVYTYLKDIENNKKEERENNDIDRCVKAYNEIYPNLEDLTKKIDVLLFKKQIEKATKGYIAGLSTLLYTLYNIKDCISLDKDYKYYKYQYNDNFYIPFLLSDDLLLNVDFLPDFPSFYFDDDFLPFPVDSDEEKKKNLLESILPECLIIEHANKCKGIPYSFYDLESRLKENERELSDNYTTDELVDKYLSNNSSDDISIDYDEYNDLIKGAKDYYEIIKRDFNGKLELSECYCKLEDVTLLKKGYSDKAREDAFALYVSFNDKVEKFNTWLCEETKNFGYFGKVVEKYSQYIDDNSKELEQYWNYRIEREKNKEENEKYKDAFDRLLDFMKSGNYSFVSEFLKSNEKNEFLNNEIKDFSTFLSDYIKMEDFCYASADIKLYSRIVDNNLSDENKTLLLNIAENWENIFSVLKNSDKLDEGKLKKFLSSLGYSGSAQDYIKDKLKELLSSLGFKIDKVEDGMQIELSDSYDTKQKLTSCEISVLDSDESDDNISNNHQFASFVPYIFKNGFRIIFINDDFGFNFDEDNIDKLVEFSDNKEIYKKHTIIVFNRKISLKDRRKLSDAIKNKKQHNDSLFLFLDRVIILFLLRHFLKYLNIDTEKSEKKETKKVDVKEIINDCLMSIILPFGFYQPYYSSTSANKEDIESISISNNKEIMFVGRKNELDKIKNPDGPFMIVYGGRQLGKSLLLRQAEKDINKNKDSIAIVVDLLTETDYDKILNKIVIDLKNRGIFKQYDIKDWSQFQNKIEEFLQNSDKKLYLFLDEVDGFIASCKNYEVEPGKKGTDIPFKIIEDISNKYGKKFNVVLAGLNLYVDFKVGGFFDLNNHIGGHLRPENFIHIKPFEIKEACELIERPLHYLGLDFSESLSLIYLILDDTNYYPCLIQMYCKRMLENVNIYSNNGPIYKVEKNFIYKFLIDQKFKGDVKKVFYLTLGLNSKGDNNVVDYTFKYLANMLAFLCHTYGYRAYTLEDFKNLADGKFSNGDDTSIGKIEKISNLETGELQDLLDLLEKLSVFEKVDDKYRFKRFSLFKLMGTKKDICKQLAECISKDKKRR